MTSKVVVNFPDHVYRRVESIARQSQRAVDVVVADIVARSVRAFPVAAGRGAMPREIEAFRCTSLVISVSRVRKSTE